MTSWHLPAINPDTITAIRQHTAISPVLAQILALRGITEKKDITRFLSNELNNLTMPNDIKGMKKSAERIAQAISNKERILIYGDYDVDGITATTCLLRLMKVCELPAEFFIPDRIKDGYGITIESAKKVAALQPDVIITVDCGITATEPVSWWREQGIDVVITDHHEALDTLPNTPYLVNPKLQKKTPVEFLAAVGVAFKLCWSIAQVLSKQERVLPRFRKLLIDILPLVALGTVADIVPLVDENRILVAQGLSLLSQKKTIVGLQALLAVCKLDTASEITPFDIGFKLGPRLNAAGRIAHASLCVTLLTTEDKKQAQEIAEQLDKANRERQVLCEQTIKEAIEEVEARIATEKPFSSVVLSHENWHQGIIGIVASRITERYNKPTIILSKNNKDNLWHGSARSVDNFHITNALHTCDKFLVQCGGHQGAAGLIIRDEFLESFRTMFENIVTTSLTQTHNEDILAIDAEASHEQLHISLAQEIQRLRPFGESNPKPLLMSNNLRIAGEPRLVGAHEKHLKLKLIATDGHIVQAIGFNMGQRLQEIIDTKTIDIVYFPAINTWNGNSSLDLHLKDFRESSNSV